MRVKMISIAAGPDYAGNPGAVIDVPEDHAAAMIEGGHAVAVDPPAPPPEPAAAPAAARTRATAGAAETR